MYKKHSHHDSQIIYFSHGGGPLPILNDPAHDKMIQFMKNLSTNIRRPDSIIVFSAHWEEETVTIQSGNSPDLIYDYYGFPEPSYSIEYPCKGNPQLASKISEAFSNFGIEHRMEKDRPYDHGSYIPLKIIYPDADIPVLQISLNHNLDPFTHLNIGKALRTLLDDNLLIIGSGFSFHNMRYFNFNGEDTDDPKNNEFQDKLISICCYEKDVDKKWKDLIEWESIPWSRYCHPREEHLLPLHICAGLSDSPGTLIFDDYILGKRSTAFLW